MQDVLIATLISEGGKLLSEFIRSNQSAKNRPSIIQYPEIPDSLPGFVEGGSGGGSRIISSEVKIIPVPSTPQPAGEKVATSCVGCAIGHLATVSGLLKEAVRFSDEGMDSPNIISRLNACLDELNAMERIDLQPSLIVELAEWERDLAHQALRASREARHFIESGIISVDQLEKLSASLTNTRQLIGNAWLQKKLRSLSTEDKAEIQRRVMAKIETIGEEKKQ